ncbi:MAG: hypothetical protein F6K54_15130 [Okeania sp. SIO3B5]|nr:hypothetical protein [Okeania sp. SIO3B5]NEO54302.1 hypothetical protein [Okeania sp. SIO3B5]
MIYRTHLGYFLRKAIALPLTKSDRFSQLYQIRLIMTLANNSQIILNQP